MDQVITILIVLGLLFLLFLLFKDTKEHDHEHEIDDSDGNNQFSLIDIKHVFDVHSMESTYIYLIKDIDNDVEYLMFSKNGSCSVVPRVINKKNNA